MRKEKSVIEKINQTVRYLNIASIFFLVIGVVGMIVFFNDIKEYNLKREKLLTHDKAIMDSFYKNPWDSIYELSTGMKDKLKHIDKKPLQIDNITRGGAYPSMFEINLKRLKLSKPFDTIFIGTDTLVVKIIDFFKEGIFLFSPYKNFNFLKIKESTLSINHLFLDLNGEYFGHIVDNKIFVNPKYPGKVSFDEFGLEVLDRYGLIIFSLYLLDDKSIFTEGYIKRLEDPDNKYGVFVWGARGGEHLYGKVTPEDLFEIQDKYCYGYLFDHAGEFSKGGRYPDSLMPKFKRYLMFKKKAF